MSLGCRGPALPGPALLACSLGLALLAGCEANIGGWCANDTDLVNSRVSQEYDTLSQSVVFENCEQPFCASTGGSRPYCTKRCQSAAECTGNFGEEWSCEQVVKFGRAACVDWSPETDCLNSTQPIRYCVAAPSVIRDRDEAYGREWPRDDVPPPDTDGGS